MKPCDCRDLNDISKLKYQSIRHNNESITIRPNYIIISLGNCTIRISQRRFEQFASWYFEDQKKEKKVV